MPIDTAHAREALNEERTKLVHQLDELGATESGDLRSDVDYGDGFADAGAATAERTERLGLAESLAGQIEEIDTALERIEHGHLWNLCVMWIGHPGGSTRSSPGIDLLRRLQGSPLTRCPATGPTLRPGSSMCSRLDHCRRPSVLN